MRMEGRRTGGRPNPPSRIPPPICLDLAGRLRALVVTIGTMTRFRHQVVEGNHNRKGPDAWSRPLRWFPPYLT